jgi:hypothetical protein
VIAIVPYEPWHGAAIAVQAAQAPELRSAGPPGSAASLGPAFSALERVSPDSPTPNPSPEGEGLERVLCCAGLIVNNPRYATAWALFSADKGAGMVAVTRAVRRVIEQADFPRIDMMVRSGFERAADFASLLGFTREAVLAKVGADGSDYEVWVRFAPKGGQ